MRKIIMLLVGLFIAISVNAQESDTVYYNNNQQVFISGKIDPLDPSVIKMNWEEVSWSEVFIKKVSDKKLYILVSNNDWKLTLHLEKQDGSLLVITSGGYEDEETEESIPVEKLSSITFWDKDYLESSAPKGADLKRPVFYDFKEAGGKVYLVHNAFGRSMNYADPQSALKKF